MKHNPWKRSDEDQYGVHHCKDCETPDENLIGGRCEHCHKIEESNGWADYERYCASVNNRLEREAQMRRLDEYQENL